MSLSTKGRLAGIVSASALIATIAVAAPSATLASPSNSSGGSARDGYNSIPSKVTGNVPSFGFAANSATEFGDIVGLGGTARKLSSMSVVFSSWASEFGHWTSKDAVTTPGKTFPVDITFNIYANNNGQKGDRLATKNQTVEMAYRPSSDPSDPQGRWYNSKDKQYYNGIIQTVTMPMPSVTLPEEVIWTAHFDASGPAASLNVGAKTFSAQAYAGTDLDEDTVFEDSPSDNGTGWTGYRPLGAIVTK